MNFPFSKLVHYNHFCAIILGYGKSRPPNRDFSGGARFLHRDAEIANAFMKVSYGMC